MIFYYLNTISTECELCKSYTGHNMPKSSSAQIECRETVIKSINNMIKSSEDTSFNNSLEDLIKQCSVCDFKEARVSKFLNGIKDKRETF